MKQRDEIRLFRVQKENSANVKKKKTLCGKKKDDKHEKNTFKRVITV